jgi:hypothetical protein
MRTRAKPKTVDGNCDACAPNNAPAPAIIFYMDELGIRPELRVMAER